MDTSKDSDSHSRLQYSAAYLKFEIYEWIPEHWPLQDVAVQQGRYSLCESKICGGHCFGNMAGEYLHRHAVVDARLCIILHYMKGYQ